MAIVRMMVAGLALCSAAPALASPLQHWRASVSEASACFGIPQTWIHRVIQVESGGRTTLHGSPITSRVGAMGLMQLMPATWREMRDAHRLGSDPHDPRDNILAGTAYLRAMYDRFGYPGLFAAYNAGPRRYAEHLATGSRLPRETISYVEAVAGGEQISPGGGVVIGGGNQRLFFDLWRGSSDPRVKPPAAAGPAALFVVLTTTAG